MSLFDELYRVGRAALLAYHGGQEVIQYTDPRVPLTEPFDAIVKNARFEVDPRDEYGTVKRWFREFIWSTEHAVPAGDGWVTYLGEDWEVVKVGSASANFWLVETMKVGIAEHTAEGFRRGSN